MAIVLQLLFIQALGDVRRTLIYEHYVLSL